MTADEIEHAIDNSSADLDPNATLYAIRHLVGVYALETGQTPRSVLDDEFTNAPSDEFWRATIGATH